MDNLLYNCKVDQVCLQTTAADWRLQVPLNQPPRQYIPVFQVFDLKGSVRSRYVNMSSDKESKESVLLDENLLESELFFIALSSKF